MQSLSFWISLRGQFQYSMGSIIGQVHKKGLLSLLLLVLDNIFFGDSRKQIPCIAFVQCAAYLIVVFPHLFTPPVYPLFWIMLMTIDMRYISKIIVKPPF